MDPHTNATPCPNPGCAKSFDCDACLDTHLRGDHGTSYQQVYGAVPETWIGLCLRHATIEPERVGGVPQTAAVP